IPDRRTTAGACVPELATRTVTGSTAVPSFEPRRIAGAIASTANDVGGEETRSSTGVAAGAAAWPAAQVRTPIVMSRSPSTSGSCTVTSTYSVEAVPDARPGRVHVATTPTVVHDQPLDDTRAAAPAPSGGSLASTSTAVPSGNDSSVTTSPASP